MPTAAIGCCCTGSEDPCSAWIEICLYCPDRPVIVSITGATVDSGDLTPEIPISGGCVTYGITIPHDYAEITVSVSGNGESLNVSTWTNITIQCGETITLNAINTPTDVNITTCVYTVDGLNSTTCPVEGASVEHTGCCSGASGTTDATGCVTLSPSQTPDCTELGSSVTVTPPGGYGAAATVAASLCATCDDDNGPADVLLYPDSDHIGHGTYFPNELILGYMCSGRYLPYSVTYTDDDGSCTLAFIETADLPVEFSDACIAGAPVGVWAGSFSFTPSRIGTSVDCEGVPNCLASDNTDETMIVARVIAWAVGDCDGVTVYIRRCSSVANLPTDCSALDQECVYTDGVGVCVDAYEAPETITGSAVTTCPSGSLSASGTATASGSECDTGRSVSWTVEATI